ncbi:Mitochondrial import inner membrane translocase subunit TIM50 [Zea mays]|uniref:Mitochondrial import inner membrane translocase subunit TIM50 n=1 Tax=Zea mays TaxID=4577 RepID=A0A1D6GB24_MAIZE|nr:Mitochondrial import inner membrane translocase subunit TIM50 [Zea mays]
MSRVAGSRLLPRISALSFCTASPATAAASSSSSTAAVAAAAATASEASSTAGDPSSQPPQTARKPWGALKFAAFAAVSTAVGGTGYVSYVPNFSRFSEGLAFGSMSCVVICFLLLCLAYSLEEVDQMTRELRKKSKQPIPEDASGFERFQAMAYSAAMKDLLFD